MSQRGNCLSPNNCLHHVYFDVWIPSILPTLKTQTCQNGKGQEALPQDHLRCRLRMLSSPGHRGFPQENRTQAPKEMSLKKSPSQSPSSQEVLLFSALSAPTLQHYSPSKLFFPLYLCSFQLCLTFCSQILSFHVFSDVCIPTFALLFQMTFHL